LRALAGLLARRLDPEDAGERASLERVEKDHVDVDGRATAAR
jgi:hypothetical protein